MQCSILYCFSNFLQYLHHFSNEICCNDIGMGYNNNQGKYMRFI